MRFCRRTASPYIKQPSDGPDNKKYYAPNTDQYDKSILEGPGVDLVRGQ